MSDLQADIKRNAVARVETLREVQIVYQVFCEEHRIVARTEDFTVANDWRHAHNEQFHAWALRADR